MRYNGGGGCVGGGGGHSLCRTVHYARLYIGCFSRKFLGFFLLQDECPVDGIWVLDPSNSILLKHVSILKSESLNSHHIMNSCDVSK